MNAIPSKETRNRRERIRKKKTHDRLVKINIEDTVIQWNGFLRMGRNKARQWPEHSQSF